MVHRSYARNSNHMVEERFRFSRGGERKIVTPWTVAHQAPLSMGFPRQEYWSGLPFPTLGDLPNPGIKLTSLASLALAGGFFTG